MVRPTQVRNRPGKHGKNRARYGSGSLDLRGRIWWVRYREVKRRPDGSKEYVQHQESTGSDDKAFAQRFLSRKLQEVGGHRPRTVDPRQVTYENVRDSFIEFQVEEKRRSLRTYRNGRQGYSTVWRLDRFFGGSKAVEVSVADLRQFRKECRQELTEAGTNRCMATLRAMFRQAVKDELLTPTEIPAYFPMFKEPNEARGAIFIEAEWYEPLRRRLGEPLRSAFTLAYHTGIRVHELLRLRWRDVEAAKQRVVLPGEITKTGKPRSVPLPSDFKRRPGRPDELVFPLGDFRTEWYEACVTVGAGKYHCRACRAECARRVCPTHGKRTLRQLKYVGAFLRHCRHTAVRNMSDAGLPETRIMAITGHVTRSMFDRYNLKREKDVELAREAIERQHRAQQARVRRTAA